MKARIKYRFFQSRLNFLYIKFILKRNREWDYVYFLELIARKLTSMGLYFAKHGVVEREDRVKQVHEIWKTRKHINNVLNCTEILGKKADQLIFDKYKKHYCSEIETEKNEDGNYSIKLKITGFLPEEEDDVEQLYRSIAGIEAENKYQQEELKLAFESIQKNIFGWWD
jgi:hypothetical protein